MENGWSDQAFWEQAGFGLVSLDVAMFHCSATNSTDTDYNTSFPFECCCNQHLLQAVVVSRHHGLNIRQNCDFYLYFFIFATCYKSWK